MITVKSYQGNRGKFVCNVRLILHCCSQKITFLAIFGKNEPEKPTRSFPIMWGQ